MEHFTLNMSGNSLESVISISRGFPDGHIQEKASEKEKSHML